MSKLQHPQSRSFERVADVYERARPEYPAEAIAWLVEQLDLREGRTVLDLGAGTGKLTRALVPTGARVVAVEPGEAMLAQLRRVVPEVDAVLGAAESIPLDDKSVDAITVGQAFHWFRHDEAIPELHRVLRPGGAIALIWNSRDQEQPFQRELSALIAPFVPYGRAPVGSSVPALTIGGLFDPVERRAFRFSQRLDAEHLVERMASISFVAAAPAELRADLEGKLRAAVADYGGVVEFAYVTEVYVSRAV
ncbi:MAG: class I SAM-dependent methyltransferase [Gaiellaceae bacterium]